MPISTLSYANTFAQWFAATESTILELNKLETGVYEKSSNTLFITSSGVGLRVSNSAVFGNVSTTILTVSGNTNFANISATNFSSSNATTIRINANTITATGNSALANVTTSANSLVGIRTTTPRTSLDIVANDAIIIPSGNDLQRPSGVNGMIRYNTSNNYIEMYSNNQ